MVGGLTMGRILIAQVRWIILRLLAGLFVVARTPRATAVAHSICSLCLLSQRLFPALCAAHSQCLLGCCCCLLPHPCTHTHKRTHKNTQGAVTACMIGSSIAIRYSAQRPQFGDKLIMDYLSHQRRLLPGLAATYALHLGLKQLKVGGIEL